MALEMQELLRTTYATRYPVLQLRMGIHCGSAVAGVIGKRKFTYDLWGDSVNTASRMESHGLPSRVHVSTTEYPSLDGKSAVKGLPHVICDERAAGRVVALTLASLADTEADPLNRWFTCSLSCPAMSRHARRGCASPSGSADGQHQPGLI